MSRLLASPLSLDVEERQGVPHILRLEGRRNEFAVREWHVAQVCARWRVDTEWWREHVARDYWKVLLRAAGGVEESLLCDVYLDRSSCEWFLSRVYD